jgi:multiple sugar transport system permease protein
MSVRHGVGARRTTWGTVVVLAAVTIVVVAPFLWMVSLAFTPEQEAFAGARLIPQHATWDNFVTAIGTANLGRAFANSAVVTVVAVAANCVVAVLAGYAFAHLPFPGSKVLFYALLSTVAVPTAVTMIPLFLMAKHFPLAGGNDLLGQGGSGLLDTVGGLMLPYLVGTMNIFLSRQFFSGLGTELSEAARLDGAGELRIFFSIHLPLARPLIAVVAIFSFTGVWDDFLWPLVVSTSERSTTVQLAIATLASSGNIRYGALMAATILVSIPVLVVFFLNQRSFISGLSDGGLKG